MMSCWYLKLSDLGLGYSGPRFQPQHLSFLHHGSDFLKAFWFIDAKEKCLKGFG
jgi:hypothetical protein